jgi:alginate O-acetyltransferase complex protein AlgI
MLFCSFHFLVFFAIVFCAYWAIPWQRARVWLLLAASFVFYATWNHWLASLIVATTTLDYFLARAIEASPSRAIRRLLLTINIALNLGMLCYFKYANFFLESLETALRSAGLETSMPVLSIMAPLGISFYTFEALNYMIDVYRGHVKAERSLPNFMLFILFFPHLLAGPIVRARDFLPQTGRPKHWNWLRMEVGVQYVLLGLIKKLAIADRMAAFVDPVYANVSAYSTGTLWVATFAYAVEIYCDFSGYSDLALGTAHLLGYRLCINFNLPYLAPNISEFWRRWHISLSSWLRDYLFIPLGGSRNGGWATCRNLLLTMALGGLWHGAAWSFVAWGVLHGMLLIVHRLFQGFCKRRTAVDGILQSIPGTVLRVTATFLCVSIGWVFFRAGNFETAMNWLARLAVPHSGLGAPLPVVGFFYTLPVVILGHWLGTTRQWQSIVGRLPAPAIGVGYAMLLMIALLLSPSGGQTFIYFQF